MDLAASPERSIVSVLAVDTVDSRGHIAGIDPDDAQKLLDRIFQHLSAAITRHGGLIVSYAGDGGMAVFGWPNSQEDHADRACDAAWSIQGVNGDATPAITNNQSGKLDVCALHGDLRRVPALSF